MITHTWPRPTAGDDERGLETDIMRFMAILGFCLMAVFALIQAIPVSQDKGGVGVQHSDLLQQELQQAKVHLNKLQIRLDAALESESLRELENQGLQAKLNSVEASLLEQAQAMRVLSNQLDSQRTALSEAKQALRRMQRSLTQVELELRSAEQQQLRQQQAEISKPTVVEHQATPTPPTPTQKRAQQEPSTAPAPSTQPLQDKVPVDKTTPSPPVLTMRFASTAAINRLIAAGRTELIGVVGNRAWRSEPNGQFVASDTPARTYELTENPGELLVKRFRHGSGLLNANSVRWLVTFDAFILEQISKHIAVHTDGALVIEANGKVHLETPGSGK